MGEPEHGPRGPGLRATRHGMVSRDLAPTSPRERRTGITRNPRPRMMDKERERRARDR